MSETPAIRFDGELGAWVVSRHAEVVALLRDARLVVPGSMVQSPELTSAHAALRHQALQALAPPLLDGWRSALQSDAGRCVAALGTQGEADLVRDFAAPWSLGLAVLATGIPAHLATDCATLARIVFLSAAHTRDGAPASASLAATAELSRMLAADVLSTSANADVQTFVALSQTLPGTLGACWLALLQHPEQLALLCAAPQLMSQAVGELLRFASPSRVVFRVASHPLDLGTSRIEAGDRVVLSLYAANHDPGQFPEPQRLDLTRSTAGMLSLGAGPHRCAGASLVRMAVGIATEALLDRARTLVPARDPAWVDGFAIRVVESLPVAWRVEARTD